MLQDFSIDESVKKIKERRKLSQELDNVIQELQAINVSMYVNVDNNKIAEKEKSKALVIMKKSSLISRLASLFHRGKYYDANKKVEAQEQQIERIESEARGLQEKRRKLQETLADKRGELEQMPEIPECLQERNGELIITDKMDKNFNNDLLVATDRVGSKGRVLVHCTDFFPRNNIILSDYDGEKIGYPVEMRYHGVNKEVRCLVHRHEVHCTINNRVESTGDGAGNWDNPSYIIIDRYDAHEDEMECEDPSDSWTKGTSIKLSKDAVIMVNLKDRNKLPVHKSELENYNIVYYDGDPTTCLRNFLSMNGYEIFYTDARTPSHSASTRYKAETFLNTRDCAINFVKDNTYFSKEPPVFSAEEITQIADVAIANIGGTYLISPEQERICLGDRELSKDERLQYLDVAKFVIGSGLRKTEDGRYTFASDDEVLADIESISQRPEELPTSIDVSLVNVIYDMQQQYAKEYKSLPRPSFEEISSMTLGELYQFKNQLACETLYSCIPPTTRLVGKKSNVSIEIDGSDIPNVEKKLKAEDGIYYDNYCNIGMNLGLYAQAVNVPKAQEFLEKKKEQLKNRSTTVRPDIDDEER